MEHKTHTYIDFKDIDTLENHLNPHGRMMNRRRTGFPAGVQRQFANAVKRARFMALLPFVRE